MLNFVIPLCRFSALSVKSSQTATAKALDVSSDSVLILKRVAGMFYEMKMKSSEEKKFVETQ